jgi:hypothetical protein
MIVLSLDPEKMFSDAVLVDYVVDVAIDVIAAV